MAEQWEQQVLEQRKELPDEAQKLFLTGGEAAPGAKMVREQKAWQEQEVAWVGRKALFASVGFRSLPARRVSRTDLLHGPYLFRTASA